MDLVSKTLKLRIKNWIKSQGFDLKEVEEISFSSRFISVFLSKIIHLYKSTSPTQGTV